MTEQLADRWQASCLQTGRRRVDMEMSTLNQTAACSGYAEPVTYERDFPAFGNGKAKGSCHCWKRTEALASPEFHQSS